MYNLIDLHIHSSFSWDSEMEVKEIINLARKYYVSYLGLSEHLDFHSNHKKSFMYYNYDECKKQIEEIKNIFPNLLMGIEVGEPYLYKKEYEKFLLNKELDFIMGSVHWIDDLSPVEDRYFFKFKNIEDAYKRYFEEEYKLIKYGNFDIVAHLTLVHRNGKKFEKEFSYDKYKKEIDDILKLMINKNMALEINCSGLRMFAEDFIPDKEVIKAYLKLGGNLITIGSDSHKYDQLFFGLEKAYKLLDELNIQELVIYKKRKPIKVKVKDESTIKN